MCVISLHLAFSTLMFHQSLLFLPAHFDITFSSTILPYFPVLKAQVMRYSAHASRRLDIWPSQMHTQVMIPRSSTRSLLRTGCSSTTQTSMKSPTSPKNSHENKGLFGVLTMFESSVSHVSHDDFALQMESKESMHRETDCWTARERKKEEEKKRKEREGSLISVA